MLGPLLAGAVADAAGYGEAFALAAFVALLPLPFVIFARETLVSVEAEQHTGALRG